MTNAQIIMNESIKLMEAGKIGTTGREITLQYKDGSTATFREPEEIHTFQYWKSAGYMVRKGEKAVAQFPIWKTGVKKADDENTVKTEEEIRMFMKKASFFSREQVDKIEA